MAGREGASCGVGARGPRGGSRPKVGVAAQVAGIAAQEAGMAGRVHLPGPGEVLALAPWPPAALEGPLGPFSWAVEATPPPPSPMTHPLAPSPHHASHDLTSKPVTLLVTHLCS